MREIKFRAWHKNREVMVHFDMKTITKTPYPGFYYTKDLDGFYCDLNDPNLYCELMQYTGPQDKNGKEIYEGDIVRGKDSVRLIEYKDGRFVARKLNDSKNYQYDGIITRYLPQNWKDQFEVIGNIWENPELLKDTDE